MPAAFSRLQLAAALIEYDNDLEDPSAPRRSAQESAIFSHLRRNPAARPDLSSSKSTNHLGVASRIDGNATQNGRESIADTRRSRASRNSLDALRNPFGADGNSEYDDDGQEGQSELEVDLSSWGLDAFIPKEKVEKSKKGKEKQGSVPVRSRTVSGGPQELGEVSKVSNAIAHSRSASGLNMRRQSTSSRLGFADDPVDDTLHRPRATSQSSIPLHSPTATIPFPSPRTQSSGYSALDALRDGQPLPRSNSRASFGSRHMLDELAEQRPRSMSQGTIPPDQPAEDNPFALQPPAHTSRFDPKATRARTYSVASYGTRELLDNDDGESIKTRNSLANNRPYSVVELLRPKVLVMPSPLQSVGPEASQVGATRDGFQLSRDGPPLPPGARTSRRISMNLDSVPNPSNSFIPNPTADLSLAQKIFRDTLAGNSGNQSTSAALLPRAQNDGEQVQFEQPPVEEEEAQFFGAGQGRPTKPAGKLYGKSLIDDLESRKAQMRSKQRVFTGDQRPTMMARETTRSSTLIDPATLNEKPTAQRQSSYGSQGTGLGRSGSARLKPFLTFDEESKHHQDLQMADRIPKNKSVFGVDTLWEQEMVKLRAIQEQERIDEEQRRKEEEEEARQKAEKHRKKKKLKKRGPIERRGDIEDALPSDGVNLEVHVPEAPPVLPDIEPTIVRKTSEAVEDEDSSDSDEEVVTANNQPATSAWHSDSEEEKKPIGPVRTTGVGLRNPSQNKVGHPFHQSDSEEDLPLAAAKQRVASRYAKLAGDSDSDEDTPLARTIQERKPKSPTFDVNFNKRVLAKPPRSHSDEEDSQPLGLRASTLMQRRGTNDDDDDKPLALHPEQQRRTQYNLFAQQQHNQMMMQAQFHNSVFLTPPMMPPTFFGPPVMNPMAMVQPPIPIPSPPPMHDESKFLSVDRWRHDVVVDGDQH